MALWDGRQGLFLILTFVVMVVIILLSESVTTALILISIMTNFLIISSNLAQVSQRHLYEMGRAEEPCENSLDAESLPVGLIAGFDADGPDAPLGGYQGGLSPGEVARLVDSPWFEPGGESPEVYYSAGGNPGDRTVGGDVRDTFDADRKTVEHGRWRNNPDRVVEGVANRKNAIDYYVREELDSEESTPWWGRWDV